MWVLRRDTFLSCKTSQWVDRMSCSDIKRHIEQLTMSMPRLLSPSGILRAVESERQCESEKAKVSVTQWQRQLQWQRAQCKRPHILAGESVRAHAEAKVICIIYLLCAPAGHVGACVCVCTSVLAAETAQRMPRTWRDIESQMPDRKGRQARTCTCMPTPQVKLRKI